MARILRMWWSVRMDVLSEKAKHDFTRTMRENGMVIKSGEVSCLGGDSEFSKS